MDLPDKIYCGVNSQGNLSYCSEKVYDWMQEYIHKESFIAWLECLKMKADSDESRIFFETTIQQLKEY